VRGSGRHSGQEWKKYKPRRNKSSAEPVRFLKRVESGQKKARGIQSAGKSSYREGEETALRRILMAET
jgi:hypothetical protein